MLAQLGHDGPPEGYWREHLITGEELTRCPIRELLDARRDRPELLAELEEYSTTLYPMYRDGHLLTAGGVGDQPARYVDVIRTIEEAAHHSELKYFELTTPQKEQAS